MYMYVPSLGRVAQRTDSTVQEESATHTHTRVRDETERAGTWRAMAFFSINRPDGVSNPLIASQW